MSYAGTVDGREIRSLYPHVYRVRFRAVIARREMDVDTLITESSAIGARARAQNKYRDIRGGIDVEQVGTLAQLA